MTNCFTLVGNIEQPDYTTISKHRSLAAAGRAYQAAHTGNMRRVIDATGKDVTGAACDAANRASCLEAPTNISKDGMPGLKLAPP